MERQNDWQVCSFSFFLFFYKFVSLKSECKINDIVKQFIINQNMDVKSLLKIDVFFFRYSSTICFEPYDQLLVIYRCFLPFFLIGPILLSKSLYILIFFYVIMMVQQFKSYDFFCIYTYASKFKMSCLCLVHDVYFAS